MGIKIISLIMVTISCITRMIYICFHKAKCIWKYHRSNEYLIKPFLDIHYEKKKMKIWIIYLSHLKIYNKSVHAT